MGDEVSVTVLGISQDGGYPQPGCKAKCCEAVKELPEYRRHPVSLGITGIDGTKHLIEVSRDLAWQLNLWEKACFDNQDVISSVYITHAHHGHIDGLGLFGKEVMNTKNLTLNCSKSLESLILNTPSWNLLITSGNIIINTFQSNIPFSPSKSCGFKIKPIKVPHRAELSDMHAFIIQGPKKNLLFLPDHDSWDDTLNSVNKDTILQWIESENIDIALIDGTFWSTAELKERDQSKIPHPSVTETLQRIGKKNNYNLELKFIHLNHTNPLLNNNSEEFKLVRSMGWDVSKEGEIFKI